MWDGNGRLNKIECGFHRLPYMSMYDLDVVSDVVPDVVPHLNGLPSKQFKARIRCGGAANYGPRITEYIAEYYRVFNTAQMCIKVNWYQTSGLLWFCRCQFGSLLLEFPWHLAGEETNFLHISQLGHEEVFGRDSRPCQCCTGCAGSASG